MTQVLIAGIPRSGTTWIAEAISRSDDVVYVHEPDNENLRPLAVRAKRELGRFPILGPGDPAPVYEHLWRRALAGGKPRPSGLRDIITKWVSPLGSVERSPTVWANVRTRVAAAIAPSSPRRDPPPHVVAKSVHCALALTWIDSLFAPRVLIVLRHPLAVISSQMRMGLRDQDPGLDGAHHVQERWASALPTTAASPVERAAWHVGLLTSALLEEAQNRPRWQVIVHEEVSAAPIPHLRDLCAELGLPWTQAAEGFLLESDRPGAGYQRRRVAATEVDRWRTSLDPEDRDRAAGELAKFPLVASRFEGIKR